MRLNTGFMRVFIASGVVLMGVSAWAGRPDHDFTVGAYYYPWYSNNFHGGNYLREYLTPAQLPELGEYNDREPAVIAQHLAWSRQAGVDFWVASWWGAGSREDVTLLGTIFPHPDLGDFKIALFYETTGLTNDFTNFSGVGNDITYIATNYFGLPNYLHIDGKPVLFVYLTRVLSSMSALQSTVDAMRTAATNAGFTIYIVGDEVFGGPSGDGSRFSMLDAVTNYDVYGSTGVNGYAGQAAVNNYYAAQAGWKTLADTVNVAFIPAVSPGFNDKGVRPGHEPLSRRLTVASDHGTLFRAMLEGAKPLAEPEIGHMMMVTSWNEWHEDTQIEPVASAPATSDDVSGTQAYTRGLDYEGYGERYLTILAEETVPGLRTPDMFDAQWNALVSAYALASDIDGDGLPEAWALRLVGAVLSSTEYPHAAAVDAAYLANLSALETAPGALAPYREVLAALLLASDAVRDALVTELGLAGSYTVVTVGVGPVSEPFSGAGDPDGDGATNAGEYAGMISWGGTIAQFPSFAFNAVWDGQAALPAATPWILMTVLACVAGYAASGRIIVRG